METKKVNDFSCLQMKEEAQAMLLQEYERRTAEFHDYGEFLNAKMAESPKMKTFWDSISPKNNKASA